MYRENDSRSMHQTNDNKRMSLGDFIWGILKGIGLGTVCGLRGEKLARFTFFIPIVESIAGQKLEDALAEWMREQQRREFEKKIAEIQKSLQSAFQTHMGNRSEEGETLVSLQPFKQANSGKDGKWLQVITHPSVVLIIGKRGSGKSALGYRILELFRYRATPYVLGLPSKAQKLLPDWIGVVQNLDDAPPDSIVLIDEAYLPYHSRESLKVGSRDMSRIVNLSRQRNQTLIFVTQEARQIDKNIASQANVIVFKEPGILQLKFDRCEFNDIAADAKRAINNINGDKRQWSYVYSPDADFAGLLENSLATFWRPELSRIFATAEPVSGKRSPKIMTRKERQEKAKELYPKIRSYRKVSDIIDVSVSTTYNYVNDYPYKT
jgi:hypothetical protein